MTTDIDVVIPTLNAGSRLARTIDALKDGDRGLRLAITVCDGGSRDDTIRPLVLIVTDDAASRQRVGDD